MQKFGAFILVAAFAVLGAHCGGSSDEEVRAIAVVSGQGILGNVTFTQKSCSSPTYVEISIGGLKEGHHGFHIHDKGDLSGGCLSTLGHYNPDKVEHGAPDDAVRHVGDLGNIIANADGYAHTSFTDNVIRLIGTRSVIGRAIVVHSDIDDLGKGMHPDSKKTGNAGGRVACGVIGIA